MNRRKLLGGMIAAPLTPLAYDFKEQPENVAKNVEPILGQLMFRHVESYPEFPYSYTLLMIWDGEKWVNENSQAGVDVKNKVLRSWR